MDFINIPNVSKKASRIALGTWSMGGTLWGGSDENLGIETILKAIDKGVTLIDTAPAYGDGASERMVGKALKQNKKRDEVVISTKFGIQLEPNSAYRDARKKTILKEVEASLKRLQVDAIDLYFVHWPDAMTPFAETADTLKQLQKEGKIKAIGVSNFSVEQIKEFEKTVKVNAVQPPYNIFEREADPIIAFCKKNGIITLGYSALCRGLLSGKMTKTTKFKQGDLRDGMDPKFKEPQFSEYVQAADALKAWALKKHNKPLIALAVQYALDRGIDISLWGARKPEQLNEIDTVLGWKLSREDLAEVDQIVKTFVKHPVDNSFMGPPQRKEKAHV